jgi:hypothetical protein
MNRLRIVCTLAAFTTLGLGTCDANATGRFRGSHVTTQVYCGVTDIKGSFSTPSVRYTSSGACAELSATQVDNPKGTSQFDDYSQGKLLFQANWTAEGGYNALTKETWETITLPPPRIDEHMPVGRPFGRVELKMICPVDPWQSQASVSCAAVTAAATGSLGDAEKYLRNTTRPHTSRLKQPQYLALADAQRLSAKRRAQIVTETLNPGKTSVRLFTLPEIIEPRQGSTHPPQTPMRIRVAAPKSEKVVGYLLQFELRQKDGTWLSTTNVPVTAAEVEGALGYKGWGWHQPGTGPMMTATLGSYRIRAVATSPAQGQAGEWREFAIAGEPGRGPDVLSKGAVTGFGRAAVDAAAPAPTPTPKATLDWNKAAPNAVLQPNR